MIKASKDMPGGSAGPYQGEFQMVEKFAEPAGSSARRGAGGAQPGHVPHGGWRHESRACLVTHGISSHRRGEFRT